MSIDRANRSFLELAALALLIGGVVLWGALGSVLVPLFHASQSHASSHETSALLASLPFLGLLATALGRAGHTLIDQLRAARRLTRQIRASAVPEPPDELEAVAARAGIGGRVVLLDQHSSFSFAYGLFNPHVAVSRALLQRTSSDELHAVLAHEHYHVRNLDPLKGVLTRTLAAALFMLPAIDSWRARYLTDRELAADRHAVAACGREPLVGALLEILSAPQAVDLQIAAGIASSELIDARIAQLERVDAPKVQTLDLPVAIRSLLGATVIVGAFLAAVFGFGGFSVASHVTRSGLLRATLLGGLSCAAPFAAAMMLVYLLLAARARRAAGVPQECELAR